MTGYIFNIQPFSLHDGSGVRTAVFLSGCNLRCFWCHNPEGLSMLPSVRRRPTLCIGCGACGRTEVTPQNCEDICFSGALSPSASLWDDGELFDRISSDKKLYAESGGGVTFSGGEPLLQPEFLLAMLSRCRDGGINTAVETALNVEATVAAEVLSKVDEIICDLKAVDPALHKLGTGCDNARILANISAAARARRITVRTPVIPGFNDREAEIERIAAYLSSLGTEPDYELIPFHNYASAKYAELGMEYKAARLTPPDKETMRRLREAAEKHLSSVRVR